MKHTLKKATSLMLAMLMVLSCLVFAPPAVEADAIVSDAGYTFRFVIEGSNAWTDNNRHVNYSYVDSPVSSSSDDFWNSNDWYMVYDESSAKKDDSGINANINAKPDLRSRQDLRVATTGFSGSGDSGFMGSGWTETLELTLDRFPQHIELTAYNSDSGDGDTPMSIYVKKAGSTNDFTPIQVDQSVHVGGKSQFTYSINFRSSAFKSFYPNIAGLNVTGADIVATDASHYTKTVNLDTAPIDGNAFILNDVMQTYAYDQYGVRLALNLDSNSSGDSSITMNGSSSDVHTNFTYSVPFTSQTAGDSDRRTINSTFRYAGTNAVGVGMGYTGYLALTIVDKNYTYTYVDTMLGDSHLTGGISAGSTYTETLNYDEAPKVSVTEPEGYDFNGFYATEDTDSTNGAPTSAERPAGATSDATWYASWEVEKYTLNFTNNISNAGSTYKNAKYGQTLGEYFGDAGLPSPASVPTPGDEANTHSNHLAWYIAGTNTVVNVNTVVTGNMYISNTFEKINHTYPTVPTLEESKEADFEWEKAPTCTEDGTVLLACTKCGYTKEEKIAGSAKGHIIPDESEWTNKVEPQVGVKGSYTYTCSECGETIQGTITELGAYTFVAHGLDNVTVIGTYGDKLTPDDATTIIAISPIQEYSETGYKYTFKNWVDSKGTTYADLSSFVSKTFPNEEVTVTAQYEVTAEKYDFNYDLGHGSTPSQAQEVNYGDNVLDLVSSLTVNDVTTNDKVCTFTGWAYDTEGKNPVEADDIITENTTIYAVYSEADRTYTVDVGDYGTDFTKKYNETITQEDIDSLTAPENTTDAVAKTHIVYGDNWLINGTVLTAGYVVTADGLKITREIAGQGACTIVDIVTEEAGLNKEGLVEQCCSVCGHKYNEYKLPAIRFVSFNDADGGVLKTGTYDDGTVLDVPTTTKDADEKFTYKFIGWKVKGTDDKEIVIPLTQTSYTVSESVEFDPVFEETAIVYTVNFQNNEFAILTDSMEGIYDAAITLPTLADDEKDYKTYTFVGWTDGTTEYAAGTSYTIKGDVTLAAVYDATYIKYTVSYSNDGGDAVEQSTGTNADKFTPPIATKTSVDTVYTFLYWTDAANNRYYATTQYSYKANVELTAVYGVAGRTYTVTLEGIETTVQPQNYGTNIMSILAGINTDKADDDNYSYTFENWTYKDGTAIGDDDTITADVTIVANYAKTAKSVDVQVLDNNGNKVDTLTLTVGHVLTAEDLPEALDEIITEQGHRTFLGWYVGANAAVGTTVDSSTVITAKFNDLAAHEYTEAIIKDATCTEAGEKLLTCTVCGHTKTETIEPLDHDMAWVTVEAQEGVAGSKRWVCQREGCDYCDETQTIIIPAFYYITFVGADGTVVETQKINDGELTTNAPVVAKPNEGDKVFKFSHWVDENGNKVTLPMTVTQSMKLTAVFTDTSMYTVTFDAQDGYNVTSKQYTGGYTLKSSDIPKAPSIDQTYFEYTFDGWFTDDGTQIKAGTVVNGDINATPKFTEGVAKSYTVTFALSNSADEIYRTVTLPAGSTLEEIKAYEPKDGETYAGGTLEFNELTDLGEDGHVKFVRWEYQIGADGLVANVPVLATFVTSAHAYGAPEADDFNCKDGGERTYVCTVCDHSYTVYVPAGAHSMYATGKTEVIGTETWEVYACHKCSHTEKRLVDDTTDPETPSGDIEGNFKVHFPVKFTDHTPVVGAEVKIYKDGKFIDVGTTDKEGWTELDVLSTGSYVATIKGAGFDTVTVKITVNADGTTDYSAVPAITYAKCDCTCHKDTFWGKIFRFFYEFFRLFTGRYTCCGDPDPMYKHV